MLITSADNKLIKYAASLKQKKYRDENNEFLAEGLRSITDVLKVSRQNIRYVFVTKKQTDKLITALKEAKVDEEFISEKIIEISEPLMNKICDTETPQQIAAIIAQKKQGIIGDYCIYLDRVRDPGNLGTIIRTAAGAGYSLIFDNCADVFSPKVIRSSMCGIMMADFCYADNIAVNTDDVFAKLKSEGYTVIAADADGKNLYEFKYSAQNSMPKNSLKVCIVIGNEANGISSEIFKKCDACVSIPIKNIESLNAAVSAAIMMYHFKFSI